MKRAFKAIFVIACVAACAASPTQCITVVPSQPPFGDVYATCEIAGDAIVFWVHASCVVDKEKRIVVTNVVNDQVVFDTREKNHPLPHFPIDPPKKVELPCQCGKELEQKKRLISASLSGKCGTESAAGTFKCVTKPNPQRGGS